jgi:hypothetical protein
MSDDGNLRRREGRGPASRGAHREAKMELTSEVARIGYIAVLGGGLLFFALRCRRFDFLPIVYLGVAFYFLPLISGHVLQSSPHLSTSIQPVVYLIATAFMLALMAAAALTPGAPATAAPPPSAMAAPFLLLAVFGLVAALVQSGGAVIQLDKVKALQHVGILYVLFETAASLACIAAVIERRWLIAAAAGLLLAVDLLAGFRNYATMTSLAVATVLLAPQGQIRLYRKALTYGTALVAIVVIMLLVHSARLVIFERMDTTTPAAVEATAPVTAKPGAPALSPGQPKTASPGGAQATKPLPSRSDTIQFQEARPRPKPSAGASSQNDEPDESSGSNWLLIMKRLIEQSEPYVIQATLVATVETGLSCRASNILKSAWLLVPPGMLRFTPKNPYPATFYHEYKPILYPDITYGTAGNIWAEMLCRFGLAGVALFGVILILLLLWLGRLLVTVPSVLRAPIAFAGVVLAFYVHRNDLNFSLVVIKQTTYVFLAAYLLLRLKEKILSLYPRAPQPRAGSRG